MNIDWTSLLINCISILISSVITAIIVGIITWAINNLIQRGRNEEHLGDIQYARGYYNEAINWYDKAMRKNRALKSVNFKKGQSLINIGRYEEAIEAYTAVINEKDPATKAIYNRGLAYHNSSQYEAAITDYTAVLSVVGKDTEALHNRALCYIDIGNYKNAVEDLRLVLKIAPDKLPAKKDLERCECLWINSLTEKGDTSELASAYLTMYVDFGVSSDLLSAIKLYENIKDANSDQYCSLAVAYALDNQIGKAKWAFLKALRTCTNKRYIHYKIGAFYLTQGNAIKAKIHYDFCMHCDEFSHEAMEAKKFISSLDKIGRNILVDFNHKT